MNAGPPRPPTPPPPPRPVPPPRTLIDLWPRSDRGAEIYAIPFERAMETIEATAGHPFTVRDIHQRLGGWPYNFRMANAAVEALLAIGLLTRLTPDGARGKAIRFAITSGCEPQAVAR